MIFATFKQHLPDFQDRVEKRVYFQIAGNHFQGYGVLGTEVCQI